MIDLIIIIHGPKCGKVSQSEPYTLLNNILASLTVEKLFNLILQNDI
jgi:hypothetical protein